VRVAEAPSRFCRCSVYDRPDNPGPCGLASPASGIICSAKGILQGENQMKPAFEDTFAGALASIVSLTLFMASMFVICGVLTGVLK